MKILICSLFVIGFTPLSLFATEPDFWLDASDTEYTIFNDGNLVSWQSKTKGKLKVTQDEILSQPNFGEKLNGRATIHFDGNDFLQGTAVLTEGNDKFTFIVLWRPHRIGIQSIFEQAGSGTGRRAALLQVGSSYGFNGQNNDAHNLVPFIENQWRLTALTINGENRNNVVIIDNDSKPMIASINIETQNVGVDGITIGKKHLVNGEYFQGDLAELMIYNSVLSPKELTDLLKEIKDRWKLDFNAPVIQKPKPTPKEVPLSKLNTEPTSDQVTFFETKIRPLLAQHCYECHSAKSKTVQGGLRLDSQALTVKGGESGPAITPGNAHESLLVESINWESYEMPPKGKLSEKQIADISHWVSLGAPWPKEAAVSSTASEEGYDWDEVIKHWAWQPIKKELPPEIKSGARINNVIDQFIVAGLQKTGLRQTSVARPEIFVRRVFIDLLGLPPTSAELEEWVQRLATKNKNDLNDSEVSQLIDSLLQRPQYGERWGRHWLDVARYSELGGWTQDNKPHPMAWQYRDWVVNAFNQDMPFNDFVRNQIAGDQFGKQSSIGTGFLALGPTYSSDGGDPESIAQAKSETLDDRVDTFSRAFLGLTVSCARCHDHKFDPIPTQDYYSIAGVFNNVREGEMAIVEDHVVKAYHDHQKLITDVKNKINMSRNAVKKEKRELTNDEKQQIEQWEQEAKELQAKAPAKYDFAHTIFDSGNGDMKVAIRGNLLKPGEVAPRRFLRILAGEDRGHYTEGSGRKQLAESVIDPNNPLTARVYVNRVWLNHFGRALVRTPSNFGTLGEKPTHPELLDYLAASFVESGWSIKALHRMIMNSATYRSSSSFNEQAFSIDGDNRSIWRMNPRRMDVETWRDSLLAVTGELDSTLGGPSINNIFNSKRRTFYAKVSRNDPLDSDKFLRLFDFPIPRASSAKRTTNVVPQQFLFMMNSPFMLDRAKAFSQRLQNEADTLEEQINNGYLLLYGRKPTDKEIAVATNYLSSETSSKETLTRWQQYCQVLLSANEFMYVR
ncbi:MAG: DUF1553 domain-containing protein [Pirellulales bacterium]